MSKARKPPSVNPRQDQTLDNPPEWMRTHYRKAHQSRRKQETRITLAAMVLLITVCLIVSSFIKP